MIKRIDVVILKDIWGPWLFGVGLFSSLLLAATYMGRLTEYISEGVPLIVVLKVMALMMPAILAKTFSTSVLLATLLGFGRLSSDSEMVALRAAGAGLYRIMAPVLIFSCLVSAATFEFDERFVPPATREVTQIAEDLVKNTKSSTAQPVSKTMVQKGQLEAGLVAQDVKMADQTLLGVSITYYTQDNDPTKKKAGDPENHISFIVTMDQLKINSDTDWDASGNVRLISGDMQNVTLVKDHVWPGKVPKGGFGFNFFTTSQDMDQDSMSMAELRQSIEDHKRLGDKTVKQINNYEFWYWNKIAIPLAGLVLGLLGAVLGIRNHRTGTAVGFALAVAIIFAYQMLANFMNVWAQGGVIPPWAASFGPLALGAAASGVIMWRRNG